MLQPVSLHMPVAQQDWHVVTEDLSAASKEQVAVVAQIETQQWMAAVAQKRNTLLRVLCKIATHTEWWLQPVPVLRGLCSGIAAGWHR